MLLLVKKISVLTYDMGSALETSQAYGRSLLVTVDMVYKMMQFDLNFRLRWIGKLMARARSIEISFESWMASS